MLTQGLCLSVTEQVLDAATHQEIEEGTAESEDHNDTPTYTHDQAPARLATPQVVGRRESARIKAQRQTQAGPDSCGPVTRSQSRNSALS